MTKEDVPSRPSLIGRKRPQDAFDHVGRLGPIPRKARPQQLNGGTEPVTQSHGCLAAVIKHTRLRIPCYCPWRSQVMCQKIEKGYAGWGPHTTDSAGKRVNRGKNAEASNASH